MFFKSKKIYYINFFNFYDLCEIKKSGENVNNMIKIATY